MEDKTLGIIYALKLGPYCADENIRMFMTEWSNDDWRYQGRDSIDKLLRSCIADYLMSCGNLYEIRRYFEASSFWVNNEYDRMISFLRDIKVIEEEKYINGMRDNPYSTFDVFNESSYAT